MIRLLSKLCVRIIPYGTTDVRFTGEPDNFKVTETDIAGLIEDINSGYPNGNIQRKDVLYFYGGLRPIVDKETDVDVYKASRKYEILDHEKEDNLKGLITVIGGKFTTSRHLAEQVIDLAYKKLKRRPVPCGTSHFPLYGGQTGKYSSFVTRAQKTYSHLSEPVVANLCRVYGSRVHEMLSSQGKLDRLAPESDTHFDIAAQIPYSIEKEMARSLDDFLFRRTGLGTLGNPGDAVIEKIASLMAKPLKWDAPRKAEEISKVKERFVPLNE